MQNFGRVESPPFLVQCTCTDYADQFPFLLFLLLTSRSGCLSHRLESSVDWRWPLPCVHSVMIVFSAQLAEGEVASPLPILLHTIYPLPPHPPQQDLRDIAFCTLTYRPSPLLFSLSYLHPYWTITVRWRIISPSYISNQCKWVYTLQPCSILSYFVQYWAIPATIGLSYPILSDQHPC